MFFDTVLVLLPLKNPEKRIFWTFVRWLVAGFGLGYIICFY